MIVDQQKCFDAEFADFDDFADFAVGTQPAKLNELNNYLQLPVENVKDPLKWWFDNQCLYLTLSQMAHDYLSIPGE